MTHTVCILAPFFAAVSVALSLKRLVDPPFRSWNQIAHWLRRIDALNTPSGYRE